MDQATERIESFKAGSIGAAATAIEFVVALSVRVLIQLSDVDSSADANLIQLDFVSAVIVALSGGLFGITYRYILRTDRNFQLQLGAVSAFGLIRGLAQIEATWVTEPYWLTMTKLLANLLMFVTAALVLNWSMQQGWIKRFDQS